MMIDALIDWIGAHPVLSTGLVGVSVLTFVGSLLLLPILAVRIPADYFVDPQRHQNKLHRRHPLVHTLLRIAKNLCGWLLILSGLLMLVLPGQGVLTILIGLMLIDFPGKFRLERRLIGNPRVCNAINWLRRNRGHDPLHGFQRVSDDPPERRVYAEK